MINLLSSAKRSAVAKFCTALFSLFLISNAASGATLLGFYPLDGNGIDPTGTGPTLTATGTVNYVAGLSGQAASFTGNDWLTANINSSGDTNPTFSWGGWVKLSNPNTWYIFLSNDNGGWDRFTQAYNGYWSVSNGGVQQSSSATSTNWTYVSETFDGTTQKLYVNGSLVLTTADSAHDSMHVITIGVNATGNIPLTGLMDGVFFFDDALTATQESTIFTGGAGGSGVLQVAGLSSSTVPEPDSLALLGIGLLGLMGARRRKSI